MAVVLLADLDPNPAGVEVPSGWRGQIDFGEVWAERDEHLWPSASGAVPTGRPLTYGCEVTLDPKRHHRIAIHIWSLDEPREAMSHGARFTLRDGHASRATGKLR